MGWNSWYIHYDRVTDRDMRAAADAMVRSGMANFGYCYINIDDCWMKKKGDKPYRDEDGAILPNTKFPDMQALADYIHGKGLRAGIYASPGLWTWMEHVGSYEHEESDARKFAEWGYDFLKYDWCEYPDHRHIYDAYDAFYGLAFLPWHTPLRSSVSVQTKHLECPAYRRHLRRLASSLCTSRVIRGNNCSQVARLDCERSVRTTAKRPSLLLFSPVYGLSSASTRSLSMLTLKSLPNNVAYIVSERHVFYHRIKALTDYAFYIIAKRHTPFVFATG